MEKFDDQIIINETEKKSKTKINVFIGLVLTLILLLLAFYFVSIFRVKEKIEDLAIGENVSVVEEDFLGADEELAGEDSFDTTFNGEEVDNELAMEPEQAELSENETAEEPALNVENDESTPPVDTIATKSSDQSQDSQKSSQSTLKPIIKKKDDQKAKKIVEKEKAVVKTEKKKNTAVKKTPKVSSSYKWYIIVNSFRGSYYAKRQSASLKAMGYGSFIKTMNIKKPGPNHGLWYKVYAGPYYSYSKAKLANNRIRKKFSSGGSTIIKRKN